LTQAPSTIDLKALNTVSALWLERLSGRPAEFPDLPSSLISRLAAIEDSWLSPTYAFELGFDLAMRVAAAVMTDPLGDPTDAIKAALETTREALRDAKSDHDKEKTNQANRCETCGRSKTG